MSCAVPTALEKNERADRSQALGFQKLRSSMVFWLTGGLRYLKRCLQNRVIMDYVTPFSAENLTFLKNHTGNLGLPVLQRYCLKSKTRSKK
jgi:hypothetical protein